MTLQKNHIQNFLENYAIALVTGDSKSIAAAWSTPALVANDETTIPVNSKRDIEDFFKAAAGQYSNRGITGTVPYIQDLYVISINLFAVQVRWALLADDDSEQGSEANYYVIRQHENQQLSIVFSAPIYNE